MTAVSFLLFLFLSVVSFAAAADESTLALFASPSKQDSLLQWIRDNASALDSVNLVAPASIVLMLQFDFQLGLLNVKAISEESSFGRDSGVDDIVVAGRILENKVQGVVYFYDGNNASELNVLTRACDKAKVPLALNKEAADLSLRGVIKTTTAYLIFNPVAGQGDAVAELEQIRSILEPRLNLHVIMTQKDRECADQAREIVNMIKASPEYQENKESSILIASGGDGTVSAVAGETMNTGIPFGVIPRGTANAFSVALGIPVPVIDACRNILQNNIRTIDGARCNDVPMILLAGLGFEAGMVNNASRELKNVIGTLAYILGGAKQMIDQQPFKCSVDIDGKSQDLEATAITVANVAPPTSVLAQGFGEVIPNDGLLDVTIATSTGFLQSMSDFASLLQSAVVKSPTDSDSILCVHAKTLTVDCDPPQQLVIDGELSSVNPIMFSIVPGGLKVLVPKET